METMTSLKYYCYFWFVTSPLKERIVRVQRKMGMRFYRILFKESIIIVVSRTNFTAGLQNCLLHLPNHINDWTEQLVQIQLVPLSREEMGKERNIYLLHIYFKLKLFLHLLAWDKPVEFEKWNLSSLSNNSVWKNLFHFIF